MTPTDVITAIGALLTGVGLIYTGIQVKLSRRTTRSQFLLQLYQLMEQHNEVHARAAGLGWPGGRKGPETVEEWIQVGRVLGLFEYIQILVRDGFLDIDTVDELYSYRLFYLANNEIIRERYFGPEGGWDNVVQLRNELKGKRMFKLIAGKYIIEGEPAAGVTSDSQTQ